MNEVLRNALVKTPIESALEENAAVAVIESSLAFGSVVFPVAFVDENLVAVELAHSITFPISKTALVD